MIRAIVAIDEKRGMATDKGIPWDLPTDRKYHMESIKNQIVIMGYGTYLEYKHSIPGKRNYVATNSAEALREGFEPVADARKFLMPYRGKGPDIWHDGGAGLLATTLDLVDELYITQLQGDFHCTKFLPEFHGQYELSIETKPQNENGITFTFQVWRRK